MDPYKRPHPGTRGESLEELRPHQRDVSSVPHTVHPWSSQTGSSEVLPVLHRLPLHTTVYLVFYFSDSVTAHLLSPVCELTGLMC